MSPPSNAPRNSPPHWRAFPSGSHAMADPRRVIVGITGASGTILGVRLLELLRLMPDVETHLVMSPAAVRTLLIETSYTAEQVQALADHTHSFKDIGAAIASGSFRNEG